MKKGILSVACALALTLGLTGCGVVGTAGILYTGITSPVAVTSNQLGTKVGEADVVGVLGLVAVGDGGVQAAAKKAGITEISHVDVKTLSVLGLFTKRTYIVYGN